MKTKKEERRDLIKESARQLFVSKNIEQTTFQEIAKQAGIGEATVYRHYPNKSALAMAIALDYATDFANNLEKELNISQGSHIKKLEIVLDYYIRIYEESPDYYIFSEHFDNFMINIGEKPEGFEIYEAIYESVPKMVCDIYHGEQTDQSINTSMDLGLAAYTYSRAFISLCQKLILRKRIISTDDRYEGVEQLIFLKESILKSVGNSIQG